ncbi:MAG: RNA methyltransferase [Trueperaceae bacterium]|nr:RNA methyltransferase [Trueperaceae bacterium]
MGAKRISSASNPLLKSLIDLKDRRARVQTGTFLVEGRRESAAAVRAGFEIARVIVAPELASDAAITDLVVAVEERAASAEIETLELSRTAFEKLSLRQNADGLAVQARAGRTALDAPALAGADLVLVIDGVEKPGNVGALMRSADAAGADLVVLTGDGTDIYNPNTVRASQGSIFALKVRHASGEDLIALASGAGLKVVTASPAAELDYWDVDLSGPVAIVVGAEDVGVDRAMMEASDLRVRIPMRAAQADSLNVSVAGALLLFEALRQRSRTIPR